MVDLAKSTRDRTSGPVRITALLTADPEPTAAGLEMLRDHFCGSSSAVLIDAGIRERGDASCPEAVRLLSQADLILIGGGDPQRLRDHLSATPAQEALRQNWLDGAVVAGCSAGAAVLGSGMIARARDGSGLLKMWDWLDGSIVAPHFGTYDVDPWLEAFPGRPLIGIPNDGMALVGSSRRVQSLGPQPLTIFDLDRRPHLVPPGQGRELSP